MAVPARQEKANTIRNLITQPGVKKQMEMAIPKHMSVDRLLRVAMTAIQRTPKLLDCTPQSLLACLMTCAELGLEPNPNLGQAYLVPFKGQAQLIPGYRGLLSLARRSGEVKTVQAQVVYSNDHFVLEYGLDEKLEHRPADGDRGEMIGAYVIFRYRDGGYSFDYMSRDDVDKIRKRSKSGGDGPWVTDYDEMAKKGLALDTPIPTPTGWSTMGEMNAGDLVFDMHGNVARVKARSEIKHIRCFRVTFTNGDSIVCDNEHRWVARCGTSIAHRKDFDVLTVNELMEALNAGMSVTIPVQGELNLPEADLPVDPYLLGQWLGDGHAYGAQITCHEADAEYLRLAVGQSSYSLGKVSPDARSRAVRMGIIDGFRVGLASLGLLQNKHMPQQYLRGSTEQRRALLAGLMDSDGHIDKARGRAHFYSKSRDLSDAVYELVASLGDVAFRNTKTMVGYGVESETHFVGWKPSFCCVRTPRKAANYQPRIITPYRAIKEITVVPSVPTVCIAVSGPTETYLAGRSMAVTHNTVIRRHSKLVPMSIEFQTAIALEDRFQMGESQADLLTPSAGAPIDVEPDAPDPIPWDEVVAMADDELAVEKFARAAAEHNGISLEEVKNRAGEDPEKFLDSFSRWHARQETQLAQEEKK